MEESASLKEISRLDKIIAGLLILKKYGEDFAAEHDIIYAGGDPADVTPEDAAVLDELGWFHDESADSYARNI